MTYNKFTPKTPAETKLGKKDLIILLQNSMSHATQIHLHNSKDSKIDTAEVIETAKQIAREVFKTANSI